MFNRHYEDTTDISASPTDVFAFVDDHARFSSHMNQSSWMMAGSRMVTEVDEGHGQRIGSHIRMSGQMLGIGLALDEVVTERTAPSSKIWETVGAPRLLVISGYRMGVNIQPSPAGSRLQVFIDYRLPEGFWGWWLGKLFAGMYARWCVRQMLGGVIQHFGSPIASAAASVVNDGPAFRR